MREPERQEKIAAGVEGKAQELAIPENDLFEASSRNFCGTEIAVLELTFHKAKFAKAGACKIAVDEAAVLILGCRNCILPEIHSLELFVLYIIIHLNCFWVKIQEICKFFPFPWGLSNSWNRMRENLNTEGTETAKGIQVQDFGVALGKNREHSHEIIGHKDQEHEISDQTVLSHCFFFLLQGRTILSAVD